MNLFTKVLLSVLATCLIIFVSVIGFSLYKTNNIVMENANDFAVAEGEKQAKRVEAELDYARDTIKTVATTFAAMVEESRTDRDFANSIMKNVLEENEQFTGVWTAWEPNAFDGKDEEFAGSVGHDDTGRFVPYWNRGSGSISVEPLVDYDVPGAGDYYLLAKNSGEEVILDPYWYQLNGEDVLLTSIVAPIEVDGTVVGVAGIDLTLNFMQEINDTIKLFDSGFGAIVSNNGTFVAHKSNDLVGKSNYEIEGLKAVDKIKAAVGSGKVLALVDYSPVTQADVYKVYSPINVGSSSTPWSLMVTIPMDEIKQQSTELLTYSIMISLIGIIILVVVLIWITRGIVNPILKIVEQIKELAKGNLSVERLQIKSKDEIGQLANAINEMTVNTKGLVQDAANISNNVSSYSEELMTFTGEIKEGIEQVSATTEELASGSTNQAQHASDTLSKIQQVDNEVKSINQHSEKMTSRTQITMDSSYKGIQSAEQAIQQMNMIEQKVTKTAQIVKELGVKSNQINQILDVINDIASQTNLLSLNAAIEAARAGEHGKGFAVVADEVRKLAEQSTASTNKISSIIESVQKEVYEAEQATNEVVNEVQSGTEVININKQAFDEIAQNISDMVNEINKVSESSKLINRETTEVVKALEDIAAISEESSAGSEELSATVEEQTASMQEIDTMARNLAEMAESLINSLSKFKY